MTTTQKLGRNDPCHCGSGLKYKRCHLPKEEEADRQECAYWKAKIRRVMLDRLADAQMAKMLAPEIIKAQESMNTQTKMKRPLPSDGVADCPQCHSSFSVARHNADWTCHKCGYSEIVDDDREMERYGHLYDKSLPSPQTES